MATESTEDTKKGMTRIVLFSGFRGLVFFMTPIGRAAHAILVLPPNSMVTGPSPLCAFALSLYSAGISASTSSANSASDSCQPR